MTGRGGGGGGGRRVLLPPINMIFKLLQTATMRLGFSHPRKRFQMAVDTSIEVIQADPNLPSHGQPPFIQHLDYKQTFIAAVPETDIQQHAPVCVWLYEQLSIRIEGKIRGFDEFMNLVIDDAVEVRQITKTNDKETRRPLGQILLKGDNVSLMQNMSS